ncbi:MAG: motility protein A [Syntrophobacteraceae bacterium CG2_30_61_12]|nr:MAG: motility protein A [Syntrophobacteraceae bacterium CG2_30_61_12]PIU32593.1 MAG: motility protein A [Syntrophobacteraceae bacterium CG07_land_8_20_14_0_80_61_8]
MDLASVIGIVLAFGLVMAAIVLGGSPLMFVDPASVLIVIGGTIGATMIRHSLKEVISMIGVVKHVFFVKVFSTEQTINQFMDLSDKARKEGLLALEGQLVEVTDPFIKTGLQLAIDGMDPNEIRNVLETEVDYLNDRHQSGAEILNTMANFFPAMGMIGTLIGLVQMLQNMSDPSSIGPAMAVALLTTFYGSVGANLLCIPMAGKLSGRSKEETLVKDIAISGVVAIANGENPRIIEQKLHSFVAPKSRHSRFD